MEVWARQDFEKAEHHASVIAENARLEVSRLIGWLVEWCVGRLIG